VARRAKDDEAMSTVEDKPAAASNVTTTADGGVPPAGTARDRVAPEPLGPGLRTAVAVTLVLTLVAVTVAALALYNSGGDNGSGAAGGTETVDVTMTEFSYEPSTIEVEPGTRVLVNLTNEGEMAHDLKVDGEVGSDLLEPGQSAEVDLGVIETSSVAWCTVPGHREAGMELQIVTSGDASAPSGAEAGATDAAVIDFEAAPAPDWQPFDPTLQPAPGGTVHDLTLHATETTLEVAPGVTQQMWTFGDQVPGPILRGKVGDVFNVTLVNDGEIGHSIDFHASKVAWNDEMRTIDPGESLTYQFEAKHAGAFMYHCGTPPTLHHIGNGMYGAIVIDPPDLAPVDHEFVFVQSELYLGPEGEPGDLTKMQDEDWDAVVFNGYVNQYQHAPIRVEPGQRVRAWVIDDGPSENSSFHIVGTVFDTVWREGRYLLQPDDTRGGSQALDLQPAQGGFVEFTFDEPGLYPIVTHKFSNVGKGALGLFQAGEVELPEGAGH
jgi:nitrite reductase (NO-forming)